MYFYIRRVRKKPICYTEPASLQQSLFRLSTENESSWTARSARITASQSFSYKREKVGVPISTAKGSQLRTVCSRQTSKEFEPGSSIILEQLVLESDSLWEDTEEKSPSSFPLMTWN
ncbi:hypothetical protein RCL_jg22303.t1 [Rhizophagus clarus]|uniref:Uncharacterized protein n=1 Tax=Rhizophagus clarus TaxID=94130 RepID=A0A8H3L726_9GLOM|nr:hypothetical protein RCL_jg22303.t1 [Rhizophagus clarus]